MTLSNFSIYRAGVWQFFLFFFLIPCGFCTACLTFLTEARDNNSGFMFSPSAAERILRKLKPEAHFGATEFRKKRSSRTYAHGDVLFNLDKMKVSI